MAATLSIVVPAWNREASLRATLDSVAAAAADVASRINLIIVDNNSTDRTRAVAEQFCSGAPFYCRVVDCSAPGAAAARNRGFSEVTTPWVMFFDSDDLMSRQLLSRLLDAIDSDPMLDIVTWDISCQQADGSRRRRRGLRSLSMRRHIIFSNIATQRFAAKSALIQAAGLWNADCHAWNDFELGSRLLLHARQLRHLNIIGATTFLSPNSLTEASFSRCPAKWETSLNAMELTLSGAGLDATLVNARRAILAGHYRREGNLAEARRLLSQALSPGKAKRRLLLLYHWTARIGRPTALIANLLFPSALANVNRKH